MDALPLIKLDALLIVVYKADYEIWSIVFEVYDCYTKFLSQFSGQDICTLGFERFGIPVNEQKMTHCVMNKIYEICISTHDFLHNIDEAKETCTVALELFVRRFRSWHCSLRKVWSFREINKYYELWVYVASLTYKWMELTKLHGINSSWYLCLKKNAL